MTNGTTLDSRVQYLGNEESVHSEGRVVDNADQFKNYMRDVVRPRIADDESSFDSELHGLASTGMETEFVGRLLDAVPSQRVGK